MLGSLVGKGWFDSRIAARSCERNNRLNFGRVGILSVVFQFIYNYKIDN